MNERDLREASLLASVYGAKCLVYGGPGVGKTPIINTAPSPVFLAVEPGLMSMRGSKVMTYEADTWAKIAEFFLWFHTSNESKKFDTLATDSISQIAEIYLRDNPKKMAHGLQLYGAMATEVYDICHKLFYMRQKHMYLICKQQEPDKDGLTKKRPYFPGNDLNVRVPHLFDMILHVDKFHIMGAPNNPNRAFHCHSSTDAVCRDRSGTLNEYEPVNLSNLFHKIMNNQPQEGNLVT